MQNIPPSIQPIVISESVFEGAPQLSEGERQCSAMRRSGITAKEIVSSAPMHQLVIGFLYAGNGLLHSRQWHPFFIQRHTIKLYITLFGCQILSFGFGRFFHFSQLVGCLGVGFSGKGTAFEQPLPSEIGYGFTFVQFIHIT